MSELEASQIKSWLDELLRYGQKELQLNPEGKEVTIWAMLEDDSEEIHFFKRDDRFVAEYHVNHPLERNRLPNLVELTAFAIKAAAEHETEPVTMDIARFALYAAQHREDYSLAVSDEERYELIGVLSELTQYLAEGNA